MLIKTLNLLLLLTSAISFVHGEHVRAETASGELKQNIRQASDYERVAQRLNETCQPNSSESDSQDTNALPGPLFKTLGYTTTRLLPSAFPDRFAHNRYQHAQTRAPPFTA